MGDCLRRGYASPQIGGLVILGRPHGRTREALWRRGSVRAAHSRKRASNSRRLPGRGDDALLVGKCIRSGFPGASRAFPTRIFRRTGPPVKRGDLRSHLRASARNSEFSETKRATEQESRQLLCGALRDLCEPGTAGPCSESSCRNPRDRRATGARRRSASTGKVANQRNKRGIAGS
jgi:hypothetical protein